MGNKNFNLREFIYSVGEDPAEGTQWSNWWNGDEPRIDPYLARLMWWAMSDADSCFISPDKEWAPPPAYQVIDGDVETAARNVERDLRMYLDRIEEIADAEGERILLPYRFETIAASDTLLARNEICSMAAYTIYCYDRAIAGLLSNDAILSAQGNAYGAVALEMTHSYQWTNSADENKDGAAISRLARQGGLARHEKSGLASVRKAVLECYHERGKDYINKTAFIKDMLDKYGDRVTTSKTIERYLDGSDYRVSHWKTRRQSKE